MTKDHRLATKKLRKLRGGSGIDDNDPSVNHTFITTRGRPRDMSYMQ